MRTTQGCCMLFKQILEAASHKKATVWPLTSLLTNHPTKMTKTCWRSKDKLISDILQWTPTHGHTSVGQPTKTYIHQFWADAGLAKSDEAKHCFCEFLSKKSTNRYTFVYKEYCARKTYFYYFLIRFIHEICSSLENYIANTRQRICQMRLVNDNYFNQ